MIILLVFLSMPVLLNVFDSKTISYSEINLNEEDLSELEVNILLNYNYLPNNAAYSKPNLIIKYLYEVAFQEEVHLGIYPPPPKIQ